MPFYGIIDSFAEHL